MFILVQMTSCYQKNILTPSMLFTLRAFLHSVTFCFSFFDTQWKNVSSTHKLKNELWKENLRNIQSTDNLVQFNSLNHIYKHEYVLRRRRRRRWKYAIVSIQRINEKKKSQKNKQQYEMESGTIYWDKVRNL